MSELPNVARSPLAETLLAATTSKAACSAWAGLSRYDTVASAPASAHFAPIGQPDTTGPHQWLAPPLPGAMPAPCKSRSVPRHCDSSPLCPHHDHPLLPILRAIALLSRDGSPISSSANIPCGLRLQKHSRTLIHVKVMYAFVDPRGWLEGLRRSSGASTSEGLLNQNGRPDLFVRPAISIPARGREGQPLRRGRDGLSCTARRS